MIPLLLCGDHGQADLQVARESGEVTRRLLAILAVVALAALVYLWPLETFLGCCALGVVGLALVVTAGVCFNLGRAAEQELHLERLGRVGTDKHPASEPVALAACISALDSIPERQQQRIAMVLRDRFVDEPARKRLERAQMLAITAHGQRQ